jgi:hypothetical protein
MGETPMPREERVGYCIGTDQYFKRDDVGIIYQMNVATEYQRSLVGATLVKAMFDRAAYGCRLFCCWCAQDIEANRFWESLGFMPIAFRAGSRGKGRVHIFWQRRIRQGDTTTPLWFPSTTSGGSIREDRLVFPIPPGVHWSDELPRILPTAGVPGAGVLTAGAPGEAQKLIGQQAKRARRAGGVKSEPPKPPRALWFTVADLPAPATKPKRQARRPSQRAPKQKNHPAHVAAARELRDRWLEHVNEGLKVLGAGRGKYDLTRELVDGSVHATNLAQPSALLPAPQAA